MAIHLVIVLLAWWWVAPQRDWSTSDTRLSVDWADDAAPEPTFAKFDLPAAPAASTTESIEVVDPLAGLPSLDLVPQPRPVGPGEPPATGGGGASGSSSGSIRADRAPVSASDGRPRGSFFGVDGYGVSFVYIVDMSGSMTGRRFDRAVTELIQSIAALRPSQSFDVLMFSDQTVRLFGSATDDPQDSSTPPPELTGALIAATPLNKVLAARWARSSFRAGHTQPSAAMAAALRLRPSGVFMLSDGKFDASIDRAGIPLPSVFDQIADLVQPIPVHCVALEDAASRMALQRLADVSGGNFHFQNGTAGPPIESTLVAARRELRGGDRQVALRDLRRVLAIRSDDRRTLAVETLFGDEIRQDAEAMLAAGDWHAAADHYVDLWLVRPAADATLEIRRRLLRQLPGDDDSAIELMFQTADVAAEEADLIAARGRMTTAALIEIREHLQARRWPEAATAVRRIERLTTLDPASADREEAWREVFKTMHPGAGDLMSNERQSRVAAGRGRVQLAAAGGGWLSADRQWLTDRSRIELMRQSRLDNAERTGVSRRAVTAALVATLGRQAGRSIAAGIEKRETVAAAALRQADSVSRGADRYIVAQRWRDVAERYGDTQSGIDAKLKWWQSTARP